MMPARGMVEQRHAGDGFQCPLVPRSRFLPRLIPDVRTKEKVTRRLSLFLAAQLGLLHALAAHSLTAVCKEPTGLIFGIHGTVLGKGKPLDEPDGMK